jgi:hypothetical protein
MVDRFTETLKQFFETLKQIFVSDRRKTLSSGDVLRAAVRSSLVDH